jgi:hypothetical protein
MEHAVCVYVLVCRRSKLRRYSSTDPTLKSLQNKIAAIGHRQSYFAGKLEPARLGSLSILVRTPDEAQLPAIVSLPCEHFSVAQDALSGPRLPGGTFGFDHLVDRAADARSSEVGFGP